MQSFPSFIGENGVRDSYTLSELRNKFVIQTEQNRFIVFENISHYLEYEKSLNEPCNHEIILSDSPRKFFLDLDCEFDATSLDEAIAIFKAKFANYNNHVAQIRAKLITVFAYIYNPESISEDDIIEVTSHMTPEWLAESAARGNEITKMKFSSNLIIKKYGFANYHEFLFFGRAFLEHYTTENGIVDLQFFRGDNRQYIQNRLINNTKMLDRLGNPVCERRYKRSSAAVLDCIISHVDMKLLDKKYIYKANQHISSIAISDGKVAEVLEKTRFDWEENFIFRSCKNNIISFARISASYCNLCNKNHKTDNTLFYIITEDDAIIKRCYKPFSQGRYEVLCYGTQPVKNTFVAKELPSSVNSVDTPTIDKCAFDKTKRVNIIKAEMKMGKTKALIEHIKENYSESSTIIMISFRRTFSSEAKAKYSELGFELYSDIRGAIELEQHKRLIIQVESLHRIDIPFANIDMVILDEIESIWAQFSSKNFSDYHGCISIFENLLKLSKRVVCMDANISDRTYRILKYMEVMDDNNTSIYVNKHNPNKDHTFVVCKKDEWLAAMNVALKDGSNIAIFTNSLKEAKTLAELAGKLVGSEVVMCYNSKTKESVKQHHFQSINTHWCNYRVVICTPTVSAGLSFEADHFDYVFGNFTNLSCGVEICRQMMGRVRNVRKQTTFITLSCVDMHMDVDPIAVRQNMKFNRIEMFKRCNENYNLDPLYYKIDAVNGVIEYLESLAYNIVTENIAYDNRSRNDFYNLFIQQIRGDHLSKQAKIKTKVEDLTALDISMAKATYVAQSKSTKISEITAIMEAKDLSQEDVEEIKERQRNLADIEIGEHYAIKKFIIARGLEMAEMDFDTIKIFSNDSKLRQFIMNKQIFERKTWQESINVALAADEKRFVLSKTEPLCSYYGRKHQLCKQLCDLISINIDIYNIIKRPYSLTLSAEIKSRAEFAKLAVESLPIFDMSYETVFTPGNHDKATSQQCLDMLAKILCKLYGFSKKISDDVITLATMKHVNYCTADNNYIASKEAKFASNFPCINVGMK